VRLVARVVYSEEQRVDYVDCFVNFAHGSLRAQAARKLAAAGVSEW